MALDVVTYDRTSESMLALIEELLSVAFLVEVSGPNWMVPSLIPKSVRTSQIFVLSDLAIAAHRTRDQTKTKDENSMRITMIVIYVPFGLPRYSVNNKFYEIINVFLRWLFFVISCFVIFSSVCTWVLHSVIADVMASHVKPLPDCTWHLHASTVEIGFISISKNMLWRRFPNPKRFECVVPSARMDTNWALYSFGAFEENLSCKICLSLSATTSIQLLVTKILANF